MLNGFGIAKLRHERLRLGIAALALTGALVGMAPLALAQNISDTNLATKVFEHVNARRTAQGMNPLTPERKLGTAARGHAADLARTGGLSHTSSDGSDFAARVSRQGYKACLLAENVARGHPNAAAVVEAWMKSPPHRANILRDGVMHVGAARGPGPVWVLLVARPC